MALQIITNHVPRDIVSGAAVPATVLADEFEYIDDPYEASFFKYRGQWYDLGEFTRTSVPGWDGANTDSYFSGTLIRFVDDGERVIVGRCYS